MSKTIVIALLTALMTTSTAFGYTLNKEDDSGLLMLVNAEHRLEDDFNPDRVQFEDTYYYLKEEAADALEEMLEDMEDELGEAPMIVSTYRSYEKQESVFNTDVENAVLEGTEMPDAIKATSKYIAFPGASEHHTALAVDLSNDGSLEENFIDTDAGVWISKNCHKYGFVVRYPKEKLRVTGIGYEPWHIRYVGRPHSDIMYQNNWCLEEYIDYLSNDGSIIWNDEGKTWGIYYTESLDCTYANKVDFSSTNCGGYIVTTCRDRDSIMVHARTLKSGTDLMDRLISRISV